MLVFVVGTFVSFFLGSWLGKWMAWKRTGILTNLVTLVGLIFYTTFPPWLAYLVVITFVPKIRGWVNIFYGSIPRWLAAVDLSISGYWRQLNLDPLTIIGWMTLSLAIGALLLFAINGILRKTGRKTLQTKSALALLVIGVGCSWYLFGFWPQAKKIIFIAGLPIVTYVLMSFSETMLIMRSGMEDIIKEDYITVARAKGIPDRVVRDKHASRNAILPVFGRLIVTIPYLLTGIVILEYAFGWPGMGSGLWYAILGLDIPLIMGYLLFIGLVSLFARLALDVLHAYMDPRVRFGRTPTYEAVKAEVERDYVVKPTLSKRKNRRIDSDKKYGDIPEARVLTIAQKLLENRRLREAQDILVELLKRDLNCEEAWYLLSFTLTDRAQQIYTLRQALRINPGSETARERMANISIAFETTPPKPPEGRDLTKREVPEVVAETAMVEEKEEKKRQRIGSSIWGSQQHATKGYWKRMRIRAELAWGRWKRGWRIFSQSRLAILGLGILILFLIMIVIYPILMATAWPRGIYDPYTGYDPYISHPSMPSAKHLLGTTLRGKDVFGLLLYATQNSFVLGLTAGVIAAAVGTALGVIAAYYRGRVETVLSRLSDVFLLLPAPIFMAFAGSNLRGLEPIHLGVLYGLVAGLGPTAILMRTHALTVISRPYIEPGRIAGGNSAHILFRHVLPHMYPMAALQVLLAITDAVVVDGFLSYLGVTRYVINWGTMLYESSIIAEYLGGGIPWHIYLPPIVAFSLFGLAFFLISRGMQRIANPRLREMWV
jgi:peptide/nickel transport system permease protein